MLLIINTPSGNQPLGLKDFQMDFWKDLHTDESVEYTADRQVGSTLLMSAYMINQADNIDSKFLYFAPNYMTLDHMLHQLTTICELSDIPFVVRPGKRSVKICQSVITLANGNNFSEDIFRGSRYDKIFIDCSGHISFGALETIGNEAMLTNTPVKAVSSETPVAFSKFFDVPVKTFSRPNDLPTV